MFKRTDALLFFNEMIVTMFSFVRLTSDHGHDAAHHVSRTGPDFTKGCKHVVPDLTQMRINVHEDGKDAREEHPAAANIRESG